MVQGWFNVIIVPIQSDTMSIPLGVSMTTLLYITSVGILYQNLSYSDTTREWTSIKGVNHQMGPNGIGHTMIIDRYVCPSY